MRLCQGLFFQADLLPLKGISQLLPFLQKVLYLPLSRVKLLLNAFILLALFFCGVLVDDSHAPGPEAGVVNHNFEQSQDSEDNDADDGDEDELIKHLVFCVSDPRLQPMFVVC